MSVHRTAADWQDDPEPPLSLPKRAPDGDEGEFAPDDDSDLGLNVDTDTGGLDDTEGLGEPVEAELPVEAQDEAPWIDEVESEGLEGTEDDPVGPPSTEYGWTDGNEPADDADTDEETLDTDLRESTEDKGDEGLGDEDDMGESMDLPPLRSGGQFDPDEEGVDVQVLDGDALPDERRVAVSDGVSWSALPETLVAMERSAAAPPQVDTRRLRLGDGTFLSITPEGLLCVGTEADPAQRTLPEVGPALCLAGHGRRVAVLAREPSGRARLSLSLDAGRTFTRLKLPSTSFPRQLLALGTSLAVILPEEGAFVFDGSTFRALLPGEIQGACLVLEDGEVQLYAHLAAPLGRLLVCCSLGGHRRQPQVVLALRDVAPLQITGEHSVGRTRLVLVAENTAWTVRISRDGSPLS